MTATLIDILVALLAVVVAPFVILGVVRARSHAGRTIQVIGGMTIVVVFLAVWGNTGRDPLQWGYCWFNRKALSCKGIEWELKTERSSTALSPPAPKINPELPLGNLTGSSLGSGEFVIPSPAETKSGSFEVTDSGSKKVDPPPSNSIKTGNESPDDFRMAIFNNDCSAHLVIIDNQKGQHAPADRTIFPRLKKGDRVFSICNEQGEACIRSKRYVDNMNNVFSIRRNASCPKISGYWPNQQTK